MYIFIEVVAIMNDTGGAGGAEGAQKCDCQQMMQSWLPCGHPPLCIECTRRNNGLPCTHCQRPVDIYRQAAWLMYGGRIDEAISLYLYGIRMYPWCSEMRNGRGCTHMFLGEVGEAGESFKQAIEIDPENTEAVMNLGIVNFDQGDIVAAADLFQRVIEMTGGHSQAYFNLGSIWEHHRNNIPEAVRLYRLALELSPQYGMARQSLTRLGEQSLGDNLKRIANSNDGADRAGSRKKGFR